MLTTGLWETLNTHVLVYCPYPEITIFLKKGITDLVELTQERSQGWAFVCSPAADSISSITRLCRGLYIKQTKSGSKDPNKNLCFLIKCIIYCFLWPTMHHTEGEARRVRENQSKERRIKTFSQIPLNYVFAHQEPVNIVKDFADG